MVENRPLAKLLSHGVLLLGVLMVAFPIWITFVAASHDAVRVTQVPLPLLPGDQFFVNLKSAFSEGVGNAREQSVGLMLMNSLIMAMMIAVGENRHFPALRLRHRLFPLPLPHGFLLDDFHHADAAGGSAYPTDLRGGRRSGHAGQLLGDCQYP